MKEDTKDFDGGNKMVFTYADPYASEESQIDVLKSFMQQFAGGKDVKVDVYPLTRLFYSLRKELANQGRCDDIPNENFSNVFLSRDPYETIGGISCQVIEIVQPKLNTSLKCNVNSPSITKESMQLAIVHSVEFVAGHF